MNKNHVIVKLTERLENAKKPMVKRIAQDFISKVNNSNIETFTNVTNSKGGQINFGSLYGALKNNGVNPGSGKIDSLINGLTTELKFIGKEKSATIKDLSEKQIIISHYNSDSQIIINLTVDNHKNKFLQMVATLPSRKLRTGYNTVIEDLTNYNIKYTIKKGWY